MQQKIHEIKHLHRAVQDGLGLNSNTLAGSQRKYLMDELVKALEAQSKVLTNKKEEEKAFEQFVTVIHTYYKSLENIYQTQPDLTNPDARLKVSGEVFDVSRKCVSELTKLSRDFYTGAYVGKFAWDSLCTGLLTGICGTIAYDLFLLATFSAVGLGMPPLWVFTALPLVIYFLEGVILEATYNIYHVAKDNLLVALKSNCLQPDFGVFGFFQKEAQCASHVIKSIGREASEVFDELKTASALKVS